MHYDFDEFTKANSLGRFNVTRLIVMVVLAIILVILANKGIHTFQRTYRKLLLLSISYMFFVFVALSLVNLRYDAIPVMHTKWGDLFNLEVYLKRRRQF